MFKKNVFDCDNSFIYQDLNTLLKSTEQEQKKINQLFTIIEAPLSLNKLFLIVENSLQISAYAKKVCAGSKWRWAKINIINCDSISEKLIAHKAKITKKHPRLDKKRGSSRNGSLRNVTGESSLFGTLGFRSYEEGTKEKYFQLQCHALVCCMTFRRAGDSLKLKAFQDAKNDGLSAVRVLADNVYENQLQLFPEPAATPEKYLAAIKALPQSRQIDAFARFMAIALSINQAPNIAMAKAQGRNPTEEIPEYKLVNFSDDLPEKLPPDPQENEKTFYGKTPFEPDEVPRGYSIIIPPKGNHQNSNWHNFNASQVSKSLAKDNQLFHFAWAELTPHDIVCLLDAITPETPPLAPEKSKAVAYLHLMFWAGLTAKDISALQTASKLENLNSYCPATGSLRIETKGPRLAKDEKSYSSYKTVSKQNYIDLSLPECASKWINHALTLTNLKFFSAQPQAINNLCGKLIRSIDETYRLTLHRIQSYHYRHLTRMPGSDIATAALTLGRKEYLAQTKIHYSSFDSETLEDNFKLSCHQILSAAGEPNQYSQTYPSEQSLNIGTPFRPRREVVKETALSLISKIEENRDKIKTVDELIYFHNVFSAYTAFLILYGAGHRWSKTPYISQYAWDKQSGFAVIRDKDTADYYHSRLIWLSKQCRTQLTNYQLHIESFGKVIGKDIFTSEQQDIPEFFFIDPKRHKIDTSLKFLSKTLDEFGYDFSGHPNRHFLKSELQENGCHPEIVEFFLGHWNLGLEAWVKTSSLHPVDYRDELAKYLPSLLNRLNFKPISGVTYRKKIPLSIKIPSHKVRPLKTPSHPAQTLPSEPGEIWVKIIGKKRRELSLEKAFRPEQIVTLKLLHEYLPDLYFAKGDTPPTTDQKLNRLLKKLTHPQLLPEARYRRLSFLSKGLELGRNKYQWDVTVPDVPHFLPKEKNRARPSMMRGLFKCRILEQAFLSSLGKKIDSPKLRLGQLLLCAILYGGLLHEKWIKAFPAALSDKIFQHQDLLWLDLHSKEAPDDNHEYFYHQADPESYRRWFADPLTQICIYHWLEIYPADRKSCTKHELWPAIESYLQLIGTPTDIQPKSLSGLLLFARARATIVIPSFLAEYAENRLPSASLPDPIWLRSLTGKQIPVIFKRRESVGSKKIKPLKYYVDSQQTAYLKELKAILYNNGSSDRKPIKKALKGFIDCTSSHTLRLLAEWAHQLHSDRQREYEDRQAKALAVSSVQDYIGLISKEIVKTCRDLNPLDFEIKEYVSLYERVGRELHKKYDQKKSEKTRKSSYNAAIGRLDQFHRFLVVFHSQPPLNIKVLRNKANLGTSRISVNLITTQQYQQTLEGLGWGDTNLNRAQKMAVIALILLYRTGARKEEIHGLTIEDLQWGINPELLVFPNKYNKLKTSSAIRRLLLVIHLSTEERAFIDRWVSTRLAEPATTSKSPLFTTSPVSNNLISDTDLIAEVRKRLKTGLQDQTAVLHHTRDSFENNHMLKMLLRSDIPILNKPHFLDSEIFNEINCNEYCGKIFPDKSSGKKLFSSAVMLGHADIDEGFRSYFHLCDWLLGYYLKHAQNLPQISAKGISPKAIQHLTGLSKSQVYLLQKAPSPLLAILTSRYRKFKDILPHQLMEKAQTIKKQSRKQPRHRRVTGFDDALAALQKKSRGLSLQKIDEKDLTLAHKFYKKIQVLTPAKRRKTRGVAKAIIGYYVERENYLQITEPELANKVYHFFDMLGLPTTAMEVTFHPSRYRPEEKKTKSFARWKEKINFRLTEGSTCQIKGRKNCIRINLNNVEVAEPKNIRIIDISKSILLICRVIAS